LRAVETKHFPGGNAGPADASGNPPLTDRKLQDRLDPTRTGDILKPTPISHLSDSCGEPYIGTGNGPDGPGSNSKWTFELFTRESVILHRTDTNGAGIVVFGGVYGGQISKEGGRLTNGTYNGNPDGFRLAWGVR
jgi:hypothetical protein